MGAELHWDVDIRISIVFRVNIHSYISLRGLTVWVFLGWRFYNIFHMPSPHPHHCWKLVQTLFDHRTPTQNSICRTGFMDENVWSKLTPLPRPTLQVLVLAALSYLTQIPAVHGRVCSWPLLGASEGSLRETARHSSQAGSSPSCPHL